MRFRALAKRLGADIGDRVEDNTLTRSLVRLRRAGLVSAQRTTIGRRNVPLYRITDEGRIRLSHYQALAFMYQELAMPNGQDKRQTVNTKQTEREGAGLEH
jgi:DNA-binding PadR family transcriptional regulator